MFCQAFHKTKPPSAAFHVNGFADAIISDANAALPALNAQSDKDYSTAAAGKGVLGRVRDQLIDNEPQGDGLR
ncbi:MAG: hypothetical protein WBX25_24810 [Rhodomicrobium sp.]